MTTGTLFITRTLVRKVGDTRYYTHRLVWSEPVKGKMHRYFLNLGTNYPFPKDQWRYLCAILRRLRDEDEQLWFDFDPKPSLDFDPPELVVEAHNLYRRMTAKRDAQNGIDSEDSAS